MTEKIIRFIERCRARTGRVEGNTLVKEGYWHACDDILTGIDRLMEMSARQDKKEAQGQPTTSPMAKQEASP